MKKVVYFILLFAIFIFSNNVFAESKVYNTENNIQKAILIEDYISRHKVNILEFINKYNISNNDKLNNDIWVLKESIDALKKIQNKEIEKKQAEEVLQAVIKRIKVVNESLKVQLKVEKEKYEKKIESKKLAFSRLWKQIWAKIDNINKKIAQNIFKDKKVLSLKESQIKNILIKLNKESLKLKNFWSISFKSEKEIKESFVRILRNIKREINLMKEILK